MATAAVINRHALVLSSVTLNGSQAQITGIRDEYATVRGLRGEHAAQFSWSVVEEVVINHGGNFHS